MGYKMTILTKKNSYTMFHPWRCDKTDYRLWNKTPSLCEAERKRFAVEFHQEDKGKALVHCLAENESKQNTSVSNQSNKCTADPLWPKRGQMENDDRDNSCYLRLWFKNYLLS